MGTLVCKFILNDMDKLKFIYDDVSNPDTEFSDEQIMLDRIVYDNKLYGSDNFRCSYSSDKFVLGTINKTHPGWLEYISEIKLK